MSEIYNLTLKYKIANYLVKKGFSLFYNEIIIIGKENIPTNGGVIFAPNHRNALMDALAILLITPQTKSTSFLARSDIFKNKKVATFLRFAKIMPAFRIRDGFENLNKNNDVFDECVDLLENNHALCIMPEGNQETDHKIRPLVKGIFRIAFSVQQKNTGSQSLQIVPVGLDYGSIEKFGKHLIINIGKPINVSDYIESYQANPPKALNELKSELSAALKKLTLHIDSPKYYQTILNAIEFCLNKVLTNKLLEPNTLNGFYARIQLGEDLSRSAEVESDKFEKVSNACEEYRNKLAKYHLQARNIDQKPRLKSMIFQILIIIALSPFAILGFVLNIAGFLAPVIIRKALKVEYHGFFSSIQFVIGLFLIPIFYIFQSLIICKLLSISILLVPFLLPLHLLSGIVAYYFYSLTKKCIAEVRYLLLSEKRKKKLNDLQKRIHKLILN